MKQYQMWVLMFSILMVVFIFIPSISHAQTDPYCDPLCNCRADGSVCPIDSYLYILLAVGIGYGIKKYKETKKSASKLRKNFRNE